VFTRWQTTWVFITITDNDVENILNIRNYQVIPKNVIENSFIVLREYARAKSKPINELENLPQVEIVRNFLLFLSTVHENTKQ